MAARGKTASDNPSPRPSPRPSSQARGPRLVTVSSPKGGPGKTTLTTILAAEAAGAGLKVAILDLDAQRAASDWLAARADHPAGPPPIAAVEGAMEDVGAALEEVAAAPYDLVVADTRPGVEINPDQVALLLRASDFIVVPCETGPRATNPTLDWVDGLEEMGLGGKYAVVLNKAPAKLTHTMQTRLAINEAARVCPFELPMLAVFKDAEALGLSVTEIRGSACADAARGVYSYVAREIGLGRKARRAR